MNRNKINSTTTRCAPYLILLLVHCSIKSCKRVRKCSKGKHPFPFERCPELTLEPMPLNTCYVKVTSNKVVYTYNSALCETETTSTAEQKKIK